ncbi:hypothetical protein [Streptomyces sp. NPDC008150]|uniref:hypothetical protein n=1 Tax=Streptomyces sp. NPDC008150 TaxID=3364816 RepID=UPI0036F0E3FC
MGNSGGSVTTRYSGDLHPLLREAGFSDVDDSRAVGEGWQVAGFAHAGGDALETLVRATGAPAIVVSFFDSDVGFVRALAPDGTGWKGLLNRETAEGYEIPLERFPVEPAVTGALAWAVAAGVTPDEEAVRETFVASAVFAEDLAADLLAALGIPDAQ